MNDSIKQAQNNLLLVLAEELKNKTKTKEEALSSLVRAGILDEDGEFTSDYPNLKRFNDERYNKM